MTAVSAITDLRVRTFNRITAPELHSRSLEGWSLQYDQLSRGPFRSSIQEAWVGRIQLYEEVLSQSVFQYGCSRQDVLSIGVFSQLNGSALWQGKRVQADQLIWRRSSEELMLRTPENTALMVLCLPCSSDDNPAEVLPAACGTLQNPALCARLRCLINGIMHTLTDDRLAVTSVSVRRQLESDVRDALITLPQQLESSYKPLRLSAVRARRVVRTALDAVMALPEQALTTGDLCSMTAVSRRTLLNCFTAVTGSSPSAFLKTIRLNGVRRLLLSGGCGVGDAAAAWGFWHFSQFSADYRQQFGEYPSQTLGLR